ncbi:hypothetical protein BHE74_00005259 [Ensete ventricosum]|nr:hypothetical protein BHE74_00005259 [Ensete ventricosum]RZR81052.1 hypothetical protein BHM03_00007199 [Ensete ventricosum]
MSRSVKRVGRYTSLFWQSFSGLEPTATSEPFDLQSDDHVESTSASQPYMHHPEKGGVRKRSDAVPLCDIAFAGPPNPGEAF